MRPGALPGNGGLQAPKKPVAANVLPVDLNDGAADSKFNVRQAYSELDHLASFQNSPMFRDARLWAGKRHDLDNDAGASPPAQKSDLADHRHKEYPMFFVYHIFFPANDDRRGPPKI